MKIFGIEGTIEEFKQIIQHITASIMIVIIICFLLWHYRNNIFKAMYNLLKFLFRQKLPYEKIKCKVCKKRLFQRTYKNITQVLSSSNIVFITSSLSSGDFFICANCHKCVGVLKGNNEIDVYNITITEEWLSLLHTHQVIFLAYTIHEQFVENYNGNLLNSSIPLCAIFMNARYEMNTSVMFLRKKFPNEKTILDNRS